MAPFRDHSYMDLPHIGEVEVVLHIHHLDKVFWVVPHNHPPVVDLDEEVEIEEDKAPEHVGRNSHEVVDFFDGNHLF